MKINGKLPLVCSIDFDFFIEENPILDMGHREEGLFLNGMWAIREEQWAAQGKSAREMMPMRMGVVEFVARLRRLLNVPLCEVPAFAAESHAALPKALDMAGIKRCDIVNFDAHHDIAYGHCPKDLVEKFDCGSWGGHLLETGRAKNYAQVYPEWRRKWPEMNEERRLMMAAQWEAEFLYWNDWRPEKRRKVAAVFLCRSGCWTPPCHDREFSKLCRLFGLESIEERPEPKVDAEHVATLKELGEEARRTWSKKGID